MPAWINPFTVLLAWLIAVNLAAFLLYGVDKSRARRGAWRIPERTLLAMAFLGGALGAMLGMRAFRHKTQKPAFRILVPLALVLWLAALVWLAVRAFAS